MRTFCLALVAAGLAAGCNSGPSGPVTETGDLATGDRTLVSGELADSYSVRVKEGQWIKVDLNSTVFDPYIILRPPTGAASENDDAVPGDRQHAQVVFRATEAGQIEIIATSFEPGESGAYTLVYEVSDTQPQGVAPGGSTAAAPGSPSAAPDAVAPPGDPGPDAGVAPAPVPAPQDAPGEPGPEAPEAGIKI
ncbi:MAG TPA: hypothetical protein VGB53_10610 [Rubricoccaceae bacterium]|jgi:hypothetical protein